jgi:hypothetical protein
LTALSDAGTHAPSDGGRSRPGLGIYEIGEEYKATVELPGDFIVPEVYTGETGPSDWPEGSSKRMIDGFRFRSEYRDGITVQAAFSQSQLRDIVKDRHVEVIEVKSSLNRPVIGQAIAGRDMFERNYEPRTVEPVVVCGSGDPALEWVCRQNGIRVEIVDLIDDI